MNWILILCKLHYCDLSLLLLMQRDSSLKHKWRNLFQLNFAILNLLLQIWTSCFFQEPKIASLCSSFCNFLDFQGMHKVIHPKLYKKDALTLTYTIHCDSQNPKFTVFSTLHYVFNMQRNSNFYFFPMKTLKNHPQKGDTFIALGICNFGCACDFHLDFYQDNAHCA